MLTDVVREHRHRAETYAALGVPLGAVATGEPSYEVHPEDRAWDVPLGHIGLNPVSVSGRTVEWPGFADLASSLRRPVVFYGGPGEQARVAQYAGRFPQVVGLALPDFAATLARCAVFVSNDSGAAHFARACGVPTVVVYGSTEPERTGPAGSHAVLGSRPPCCPCYRKRCEYSLECLDTPVSRVVSTIESLLP
jgi:heptosyltransferase-2